MNRLKNYLTPFMTGIIVLSLSSCVSSPVNRHSGNAKVLTPETTNTPTTKVLPEEEITQPSTPIQAYKPTPVARQSLNSTTSSTQAKDTLPLTIYQADSQCQMLVTETVPVPVSRPVDAAVGTVLKHVESGDFDLAGYRVRVNSQNGVATVDLRLSPNSRRKFVSLSSCEQFALFGSLRKTLTDNPQLKIKNVRFTHRGEEIVL